MLTVTTDMNQLVTYNDAWGEKIMSFYFGANTVQVYS